MARLKRCCPVGIAQHVMVRDPYLPDDLPQPKSAEANSKGFYFGVGNGAVDR